MTIIFQKERPGKPHSMRCVRGDGSATWQQSDDYHVLHDLAHYAVEQTCGFQRAFYGTLAKGADITDYEKPRAERPVIEHEAALAECLVAVLQHEVFQGRLSCEDFNTTLAQNLSTMNSDAVEISGETIERLRQEVRSILTSWADLPVGDTLSLNF